MASLGSASAAPRTESRYAFARDNMELEGITFDRGQVVVPRVIKKVILLKQKVIEKSEDEKKDMEQVAPKKAPLVTLSKIPYTFNQVKNIHAALLQFWEAHAKKNHIDVNQYTPSFGHAIHRWVWSKYADFQKQGKKDEDTVHYIGPRPLYRSEENIKINFCFRKK